MRAVGERSAPDMARLAAGAAREDRATFRAATDTYLIAAGMAGYLAQGKRAEAAALWDRYPADVDRLGDVGLRLLHAHAFAIGQ
mgnify:CR=1 FL=1